VANLVPWGWLKAREAGVLTSCLAKPGSVLQAP
jgi:hypothetical protein